MECEVLTEVNLNQHDQLFKLIIIGDTGVGKSCLMKRVMENQFKEEHQVTIGVEFGSFGIKINDKDSFLILLIILGQISESIKIATDGFQ
jgi:Ras-related protein Rab-2A